MRRQDALLRSVTWMLLLSVMSSLYGCGEKRVYLRDSMKPTMVRTGETVAQDAICMSPGSYATVFEKCTETILGLEQ